MHFIANYIGQQRTDSSNNISIKNNSDIISFSNNSLLYQNSTTNNISKSFNYFYPIYFGIIGFGIISILSYSFVKFCRRRFQDDNNQYQFSGYSLLQSIRLIEAENNREIHHRRPILPFDENLYANENPSSIIRVIQHQENENSPQASCNPESLEHQIDSIGINPN